MIGDRIKKLRKSLDLTQEEFSGRIGIKRNTIAKYETGRGEPIDAVMSLICREFNVSETWLRTGEGEMFVKLSEEDELSQVFSAIAVSDDELIKRIIRAYWKLDDKEKAAVKKLIDGFSPGGPAVQALSPAPADTRTRSEKPVSEWTEAEIDAEAEEYRRELLEEKRQAESGSASSGSGGTKLA